MRRFTAVTSARLAPLLAVLASTAALAKDRVTEVRARRAADVKALVEKAGLAYPPDEVYLRAFKQERQLELWAGKKGQPLTLLRTYPVCAASGELGPKRKEGDLQVPEGFYEVSQFNPTSDFHLSLRVSYPNASDKVRSDKARPGGLIYLHGGCASIGCIAIEDGPIEEVYLLALDAKVRVLPFHIFPARMTAEGTKALPKDAHGGFWAELQPGYEQFEATRRPPKASVNATTGAYAVQKARGAAAASK